MKISKSILQAMLVAVTAGAISSCEKPTVDDGKKPGVEKPKVNNTAGQCPACGMG
ncbi:MAG: hypothetical protein ABIS01_06130 [Ferruginibacter sp.]